MSSPPVVLPSVPWPVRLTVAGTRLLGPVLPSVAEAVAYRLAFFVRPVPRPAWETALMDSADDHVLLPWRGGHLAAWSWGTGRTVVLSHGWEGRGTQLGKLVEPLVAAGFRVLAYDAPGHGASTVKRASLPDLAEALARVGQHTGPVHAVVGHSLGAAAATLAASRGFTAERYALIAPPTDSQDYFDTLQRLLALPDAVHARVIARAEQELHITVAELALLPHAPKLTAPALIVHDEDDKEVAASHGIALAGSWPGSELLLTHGLGHRRVLKDAAVLEHVVRFLAEER